MDGQGTVKAAHKPHQWTPAPRGGHLQLSVQVGRNPVLLGNTGVGDMQSKVTGLFLFPKETEITGFVPGENGKAQQQALWEALVLERLKPFH